MQECRKMRTILALAAAILVIGGVAWAGKDETETMKRETDKSAFEQAVARNWDEVFADSCTGDWQAR